MKKIIYSLAIAATLLAGIIFNACQSAPSTQEEEAAQAKLDSANLELKAAQNTVTTEELEAFKIESAQKIRNNELIIADFKDRRSTTESKFDALYTEKLNKLEQQNMYMKARIDNYEKTQSNWTFFKRDFNRDMDELGQALKNITVDNK